MYCLLSLSPSSSIRVFFWIVILCGALVLYLYWITPDLSTSDLLFSADVFVVAYDNDRNTDVSHAHATKYVVVHRRGTKIPHFNPFQLLTSTKSTTSSLQIQSFLPLTYYLLAIEIIHI
jgi:hypothetical protein